MPSSIWFLIGFLLGVGTMWLIVYISLHRVLKEHGTLRITRDSTK